LKTRETKLFHLPAGEVQYMVEKVQGHFDKLKEKRKVKKQK
jgi:hypothetical protein